MEKSLSIKEINIILSDVRSMSWGSKTVGKYKLIHEEVVKEVDRYYPSQGEEGEHIYVYDVGLKDGIFLKLNIGTDSYGEERFVRSVSFVEGREKKVVVYEF